MNDNSRDGAGLSPLSKTLFEQVVLPKMDDGYRLARWLTGNSSDAEDVLQDACLKAYRSIGSYSEGNARAWFLTIVRNASYSWLRKNRPQTVAFIDDLDGPTREALDAGHALADIPSTPEEVLIVKTEAARLNAAIEALPVHFREALVLREYHGLSYREIAEVIHVPVGTVMSRLANGRRHLMKWAQEDRVDD